MTPTVKRVMDVDAVDWLIDVPIPCPKCGNEAVAKSPFSRRATRSAAVIAVPPSISPTPCTRAYLNEFSRVLTGFLSGSDATAKKS